MTLGSPVSHTSPISHTTPFQQTAGGQYLPGFLMGDHSISKTPVLNRSLSAAGQPHAFLNSPTFGGSGAKTSPCPAASPGNQFSQMIRSRMNTTSIPQKEKAGAPPVSSLVNDDSHNSSTPPFTTNSFTRSGVTEIYGKTGSPYTPRSSDNHTPRLHTLPRQPRTLTSNMERDARSAQTPPSPAQIDPFYTQGEALTSQEELDETWVTVFGFPPTASAFILQQFSKCGVILEHCSAPDEGNWINIRFESKLQSRKALSKSGKILPGNLMIGVAPCIDLKVISKSQADPLRRVQQDLLESRSSPGLNSSLPKLDDSKSAFNSPKPCTIRPLTAAYNAASSGNKVTTDVLTPQKTSGIITKAMDYIFG